MRKLLAVIIVTVFMIMFSSSFADSGYYKFSTYGSTEGVEDLFDGDLFSLSLYMDLSDPNAYFIETTWKNGQLYTLTLRAEVKSKTTDDFLYFVLENGHIIKGHYDQNGYDFWMDYDSGSIKLHMDDEFNPYFDYIGGKYAQEAH